LLFNDSIDLLTFYEWSAYSLLDSGNFLFKASKSFSLIISVILLSNLLFSNYSDAESVLSLLLSIRLTLILKLFVYVLFFGDYFIYYFNYILNSFVSFYIICSKIISKSFYDFYFKRFLFISCILFISLIIRSFSCCIWLIFSFIGPLILNNYLSYLSIFALAYASN